MINSRSALAGAILTLLASSVAPLGRTEARPVAASAPVQDSVSVITVPTTMPIKVGKPYRAGGRVHVPSDDPTYEAVGYASWYGHELAGNRTASGERFAPDGITAAHRTLPLSSYVEVTSLRSGRTIIVRINDRGPFSTDRLIDLSHGAAEQLGIKGHGPTAVRIRRVTPSEEEQIQLRSGARAMERVGTSEPQLALLRARLDGSSGRSPSGEAYAGLHPPPSSPAKVADELSLAPDATMKPSAKPQNARSVLSIASGFNGRDIMIND